MVAETILKQLGGRRFAVMTGANNFIDGGDSLSMKLKRNQSGANYLRITLTPADEYKMEFIKANVKGMKTIKEFDGVFCDQLQNFFTEVTGMYTRL